MAVGAGGDQAAGSLQDGLRQGGLRSQVRQLAEDFGKFRIQGDTSAGEPWLG